MQKSTSEQMLEVFLLSDSGDEALSMEDLLVFGVLDRVSSISQTSPLRLFLFFFLSLFYSFSTIKLIHSRWIIYLLVCRWCRSRTETAAFLLVARHRTTINPTSRQLMRHTPRFIVQYTILHYACFVLLGDNPPMLMENICLNSEWKKFMRRDGYIDPFQFQN